MQNNDSSWHSGILRDQCLTQPPSDKSSQQMIAKPHRQTLCWEWEILGYFALNGTSSSNPSPQGSWKPKEEESQRGWWITSQKGFVTHLNSQKLRQHAQVCTRWSVGAQRSGHKPVSSPKLISSWKTVANENLAFSKGVSPLRNQFILLDLPLYVILSFSLASFNIPSLFCMG